MKQVNNIKLLGAVLVLLVSVTSCMNYNDEVEPVLRETTPLTLYLQTADKHYSTRAYEGDVDPISELESTIKSVKVWIYDHDDGRFLAYAQNNEGKVTLDLPMYIVSSKKHIDVYAIGNVAGVGLEGLNAESGATRDALKDIIISGTLFTPNTTMTNSAMLTDYGLPMSCIEEDYDPLLADGTVGDASTLPQILMTRAVSKIRFAFGRATDFDNVAITGIEIDGGVIPVQEYIFPIAKSVKAANYATMANGTYNGDRYPNIVSTGDDAYIADAITYRAEGDEDFTTTMIGATRIQEYDDPTIYIWPAAAANGGTAMTTQQYDSRITSVINGQYDYTTYLRETDKVISGTIHYMVNGEAGATTFTMAESTEAEFARNHEWIVYAYFDPAKLNLTITVQPWELIEKQLEYDSNVTVLSELMWSNYNTLSVLDDKSLVLQSVGDDLTLVGTFEIGTPKGIMWTATFNSTAGNPNAFKFLDEDGNKVNSISGEIGVAGGATIRIVADDPTATIDSKAELLIVVPIEGRNRPVDQLSGWTITQRGIN